MDGWMDGWMNGWIEVKASLSFLQQSKIELLFNNLALRLLMAYGFNKKSNDFNFFAITP